MPKVLACLPAHRCGPGEALQWTSRGPCLLGTHSLGRRQNHARWWDKICSRGMHKAQGSLGEGRRTLLRVRKDFTGERLEERLNI